MMTERSWSRCLVALVFTCLVAGSAAGQTERLEDEVLFAQSLSSAQRTEVRSFAARQLERTRRRGSGGGGVRASIARVRRSRGWSRLRSRSVSSTGGCFGPSSGACVGLDVPAGRWGGERDRGQVRDGGDGQFPRGGPGERRGGGFVPRRPRGFGRWCARRSPGGFVPSLAVEPSSCLGRRSPGRGRWGWPRCACLRLGRPSRRRCTAPAAESLVAAVPTLADELRRGQGLVGDPADWARVMHQALRTITTYVFDAGAGGAGR